MHRKKKKIDQHFHQCTMLVIAHRLETVVGLDKVCLPLSFLFELEVSLHALFLRVFDDK